MPRFLIAPPDDDKIYRIDGARHYMLISEEEKKRVHAGKIYGDVIHLNGSLL